MNQGIEWVENKVGWAGGGVTCNYAIYEVAGKQGLHEKGLQ